MLSDAIETFWIRKVEAHKKMREASFAEMEREYAEQQANAHAGGEAQQDPIGADKTGAKEEL